MTATSPPSAGSPIARALPTGAAVALLIAAVITGLTDPPIPLVVTLTVAAWSIGRTTAVAVFGAWLAVVLGTATDIRSVLPPIAGAVLAILLARRLAKRCVRPVASLRQAGLSLALALGIAIPAGVIQLMIAAGQQTDEAPRRVIGMLAAISGGVAVSRWLAQPRPLESTVPLGVIAITAATMVATAEFVRYRDVDRVDAVAETIASTVTAAHDRDLALIEALVAGTSTSSISHENFEQSVSAVLKGNVAIAAMALVEYTEGSALEVTDCLTDEGEADSAAVTEWLMANAAGSSDGDPAHEGTVTLEGLAQLDRPDGTVPYLVHSAAIAHGHEPEGPLEPGEHRMFVLLSVPELLRRASGPSLADTGGAWVSISNVDDSESPIWTQGPTGDGFDEPGPADTAAAATALVAFHDLELELRVVPSTAFGVPHSTLQAFLVSEGVIGLLAFGALSVATARRNQANEGRRKRQAMLDAALAGSRGWTAIVDATDVIRIGNGERMGMPTEGNIGDSLYWKGDSEATHRVRAMLAAARGGAEQALSHMWTDPQDPSRIRFFELHARPIPDADNDEGLCLFQCVEVTDEREQAIRTAQAERMASIGELAGGLAHDFNNLLFVALGNLQLIERRAVSIDDELLNTWAGRGIQAVQRGSEIAKALLTVSGRYPVNETVIVLDDFVREMAALIEQSVGRETSVEYRLEAGLEVRVDPGRLSSSILNLCVNARHALEGREHPTVTIELRRLAESGVGLAEFAVVDNGAGMSAEVAARAFEPFFSTKPRGKGSGLGLASVFSFAGQSGGWTAIESTEGEGTRVRFALPLVDREPTDAEVPEGRAIRQALVVDDEVELARLVAAWLEDEGLAVRVAHDGLTARRIIEEQAPDLLVTDINLGEGDSGVGVADALRQADPRATIVFMTAYADRVRTLAESGHTTLAKPFSATELAALVRPPRHD